MTGTIRNESDKILEAPAVVLGGSVVVLQDIAARRRPPTSACGSDSSQIGAALSDKIVGQVFFGDAVGEQRAPAAQRRRATGSSTS